MGNSFLIHTNVDYAPPMPNIYGGDSDLEKQLQKNLIGALAAEQKFYDMLGCANIMDFMRKYNEMMSSLNKDARVLKQLSSVNIRERILNKYQRGGATGAQDEVIVLTATGAHVDARILATPLFPLSKGRWTRLTSRKQDVVREL